MPLHFKVHELLKDKPAELAALEEFARDPARTVDDCWDWMQAKGYVLARSSVGTWKKQFTATDRFAASNEVARSMVDAAKAGGAVAIGDAATLQIQQMIFEQSLKMQSQGDVSTKELWALAMASKSTIEGKRHVEKLKSEIAAALAEAEKSVKAGGSTENVVNKVREILGIGA
jgi:hypothetical protein